MSEAITVRLAQAISKTILSGMEISRGDPSGEGAFGAAGGLLR